MLLPFLTRVCGFRCTSQLRLEAGAVNIVQRPAQEAAEGARRQQGAAAAAGGGGDGSGSGNRTAIPPGLHGQRLSNPGTVTSVRHSRRTAGEAAAGAVQDAIERNAGAASALAAANAESDAALLEAARRQRNLVRAATHQDAVNMASFNHTSQVNTHHLVQAIMTMGAQFGAAALLAGQPNAVGQFSAAFQAINAATAAALPAPPPAPTSANPSS